MKGKVQKNAVGESSLSTCIHGFLFFLIVSIQKAIEFTKQGQYDLFVAVGGGSVIDTCKASNLFLCAPDDAELLDYVSAPLGRGQPIDFQVKPLIASD